MKRLLPLFLLCLLAASSQAEFTSVGPSQGPICASTFPVQFQGSNIVAGTYTAQLQDYLFNTISAISTTVGANFVNALFDLTGLAAGPGTVSIQAPGGSIYSFPFTIDPCPGGSGVQVRLYGAATVRAGRTWQYVLSVINFGTTPSTPNPTVQVDGIPDGTYMVMNAPAGSTAAVSPPLPATEQGFTVTVLGALPPGNSADFVFNLTPQLPSAGFTYPLGAHFTSVYVDSDSLPITVVGSMDPNDKTGPPGVGAAHYLKGDSMLAYNIVFENVPDASAPAQQVVITDQLDPTKVYLSTFLFGPITFGNQLVTPPFGMNPFTVFVPYDVDGNPFTTEDNILVQIDGNLDVDSLSPTYGQITWIFQSLDPGGLPLDPLIGFLPPDITPPEGQGSVSFQIFPRPTLVTDDTIANQAIIVFDVNAPIVTPTWINAIDKTPPTSRVLPLPPVQSCATFLLTWSGQDRGAGVASFTIYVSENGGSYMAFLTGTTATSALFTGQPGKTYRFYSVATDLMGFIELAPTREDARTRIHDTIPPLITCPANIVLSNDPGTCSRNNVTFTATATDNCSGVTITYSIAPGSSFPTGTTPVTATATDASGNQTTCAFAVTVNVTEDPGHLYPIALSATTLAGVAPGSTLPDILNGTQPGNFGWLTWAGSPSVPTLVTSLTPPGDSFTYVNPANAADHVISVGDWVQGKPGVSNSKNVRDALDALKTIDINVPVWDQSSSNGNNTSYRIVGFAKVRLISYQLPGQSRITARYLGPACP